MIADISASTSLELIIGIISLLFLSSFSISFFVLKLYFRPIDKMLLEIVEVSMHLILELHFMQEKLNQFENAFLVAPQRQHGLLYRCIRALQFFAVITHRKVHF